MTKSKRGLGKGLDALIGQVKSQNNADSDQQTQSGQLQQLAIESIQRGQYQPRRHFEQTALEELASSIKAQGLLQPIVVRPIVGNKYEIIAGERRWRACQLAELKSITAIVQHVDDEAAIVMALIENLQREDLNPVEEALALQRLQQEFNLSQQQVANAVGKPRSTVANIMRLTSLHPTVLKFLERGDIETGHAKCLLALDKSQHSEWAQKIIDKALTVRQLEAQLHKTQHNSVAPASTKDPNVNYLENQLSEKLGAKVEVQQNNNNKGKLLIYYNSLDELDGILKHIK